MLLYTGMDSLRYKRSHPILRLRPHRQIGMWLEHNYIHRRLDEVQPQHRLLVAVRIPIQKTLCKPVISGEQALVQFELALASYQSSIIAISQGTKTLLVHTTAEPLRHTTMYNPDCGTLTDMGFDVIGSVLLQISEP